VKDCNTCSELEYCAWQDGKEECPFNRPETANQICDIFCSTMTGLAESMKKNIRCEDCNGLVAEMFGKKICLDCEAEQGL
jgi:hypothetical protein